MFQTVGDNMTTDTASQAMISTLKAYEMGVDEAEDIVDKYNIIANNFSIDTAGLAAAIERSGGALKAASNSFAESLAIITAGNASIQDPTSVAQLLKTMSMRLNGASAADLEALGIDTSGMAGGKKSIVKQFKAMAGINIMEGTNYKSTFQILDELYEKWDSLTMAERQAIAEASGGKRAGSVFASLMTNWEDARNVVKMAEKSQGSAERELENASNSVQFSLNRLKSSWQELAYDFMNSKALKQAVEVLVDIVNAIDNVTKSTDGLIPTLASVGVGMYVFGTFTGLIKPIIGLMKALTATTEGHTKATLLDTLANKANALSEKILGKAKRDTARDSAALTAQQGAETAAQTADIGVNTAQSASERLAGLNDIGGGMDEAVEELAGDTAAGSGLLGLLSSIPVAVTVAVAAVAVLGAAVGATAFLVNQRNEELRESARKLAESYKESSDEITDYKKEITDLHDKINDSTTTYDEAKKARERLLEIQGTLIEKYKGEKENIDLVTSAINGQIDALDKLNEREWQKTKNEYNKQKGLGWADFWNRQKHGGAADNIGIMQYEMNNAKARLQAETFTDIEFLQQLEKLTGGNLISNDFSTTLDLNGNLEELLDNLYQIQRLSENVDISDSLQSQITSVINANQENLSDIKNMYDMNTLYEEVLPKYKDELRQFEEAYSDYSEAIITKDEETKQQLLDSAKEGFVNAYTSLSAKDASKDALDYFKQLYPDAQGQIGLWQLEAKLNLIPTIETEEVEIDKSGIEKQLKEYSKGGNVDLTLRPQIPTKLLKDVGWSNAGEGTATTFTNTYTSPDEKIAVNFTPIITDENGNYVDVMEPEALQHYAEGVINGDWTDNLKLQIGAEFKGDDAIQQAEEAAEKYHQLQEEFYLGATTEKRETEVYNLSDQANELIEAARYFENEKDIINFDEGDLLNVPQEKIDAFNKYKEAVDEFGISYEQLINRLRETGNLEFLDRADTDRIANKIQEFRNASQWQDNGYGSSMISAFKEQERNTLKEAINASGDDYETILAMGDTQWESIAQKADELKEKNGEITLSTAEWLELLREGAEEYRNIQEAAEEVNGALSPADMAETLVNTYEKAFKAIGSAYQDMVEKEFNVKNVDWSSITAIREEMKGLQSNLKLDGVELNTSAYDHLIEVLTNADSKAEDVKDAFENLGSAIIASLDGVDETNIQVVESFLETKGVADASLGAFIAYANSMDEAKMASKGLIDENGNLTVTCSEAAQALVEEMYAGQNTEAALQYLQLSMQAVSGQKINLSQPKAEFAALAQMAIATGVAVKQALNMQKAKDMYDNAATHNNTYLMNLATNRLNTQKEKLAEETKAATESLLNGIKIDPSKFGGGGAGGKKGGGGGGGSKKEKEEEVDVLKELSAQLDEIQAAYASLTEITEKYNETGKLTVDQAQELINTDFHFLAMLKEENGQLKLNEQGMQDLAKAKITEMQIQLARNAIDTVNKLQTEADAINFLKYAYEGLAGATLDATEAQLKMAVAAAKARGEAQGSAEMVKAAESIYQGYLATKQAIGNTDFSKESLKGDQKDKTKETKDKDKDKDKEEKEETKTRFNWLEQLVNNIQRTIDRLAKRAEKYFSYMEKNAMVDKQIAANRRMINTQEVASAYYSSKAGKALKKVPKKYRKLVSGDFDAATVKKLYADVGEKGTEKLNTYLDWKTLRDESQDKLADAYDRERELIASKMDNILSYFDTLIGYQQNIVSGIEASMKLDTAKGLKTDINKIIAAYGEEKDIVEKSAEREEAYRQEAASNTEAIRNSYNSQIDQTQTGYQNTTDYQKLKNKGKQGKAKSTIQGGYEVLEEDITEAIAAAKKLNSKKSSKQAEGRAVLERLHQKYVDRITELQREADEVEKANQEKLADQIEQNKTMTKEAEIAKWERMKSVLEEMGKVYDSQISQLGTLIDKYETLADLLKSVDASTIAKYNVNDIFGLTGDNDSDRKSFIQKSIDSTKSMIEEYKKQYALYGDIVNAMEGSAADRQQKFLDILKKNNLDESSKKIVEDLAKELADNNWEGNEYLEQYKQMMSEIVSSIAKSIKQIEDYSDELADSVTKATQKIIDALKLLQDAYASKASLINDSWVVDINGITKFGYAKVSALSQEMNIARQRADQFRQQITDIENAGVNTYGSQDEYDEARNTAIKNYYEALQNAYSVQNEIYEIAKKAAQVEIDNVSKLVENYKKALNSKKAYYDYDKTLREKNKNIQALEAEMKALENVGDAASKARLKAIQAELKEAQEDLDDTVFEHSIQVETDALDKLIEDMTNALDNSAKTIQETFEEFARTVSAILSASSGVSSDAVYNDLIGFIMNGKTTGVISGSVGSVGKATSNSSTVAKDMKDGTLTSLNEKSLSNINTNVLNILNKQKELTALQSKISSANNSLPNIANQVTKISTNVETIAKNTTSMAKGIEALNQSNQQLQALIPMMQRPGEWNEIFDQLKRRGIIRYYY